MKLAAAFAILAAAVVLIAGKDHATPPIPYDDPISDEMPPVRFRGAATITLQVVASQEEVERHCGRVEPPKKRIGCAIPTLGRHGRWRVVLPDSCPKGEQKEDWARWLCHEVAHVRGWGVDHER